MKPTTKTGNLDAPLLKTGSTFRDIILYFLWFIASIASLGLLVLLAGMLAKAIWTLLLIGWSIL